MDRTAIGRYRVVRQLGRGGMGTLFLARDPVIDRLVAIKLLRDDLDSDDVRARFEREARFAGGLRHPNIVTVFDVGDDRGHPFIAMEYINGETLQDVIRDRRTVSLERRLEWIEELCAGLDYAHQAGVIHRDIKPANLMINAEGTLKILDFGVARLAESEMTRTGMVVGTLNYMAPEQMESRPIDARADIFSVGAVAYELLAYRRAFPGDVARAVMHQIFSGSVEPLATVCPSLDPEISSIVNRCLEKEAAKRWPDLDEVRQRVATVRRRLANDSRDAGIADVPESPEVPARVAMVLDAAEPDAVALEESARAALERQQVDAWLVAARAELERGGLTAASVLVDRALSVDQASPEAHAIKQVVHEARRRLAEERERSRARDLKERVLADQRSAEQRGAANTVTIQDLQPRREETRPPHRAMADRRRYIAWALAGAFAALVGAVVMSRWGNVPPPADAVRSNVTEKSPSPAVSSVTPQAQAAVETGLTTSAPESRAGDEARAQRRIATPADAPAAGAESPKDGGRAAALSIRGRDLTGKGPSDAAPSAPPSAATNTAGGDQRPLQAPAEIRPAVAPTGPLRVGGVIAAPSKIKDVRPDYPAAAQYERVQGMVIIEVTLGADGKVAQTKILRSIPLLDAAAEDAVKQWQYTPTIVDGKAVPVVLTVTANFVLPEPKPAPAATESVPARPGTSLFALSPNKATALATQPLPAGTRLEFSAAGLQPNETVRLHRCGEPCNTARTIRAWSAASFKDEARQTLALQEPGRYYFWIERMVPGGERTTVSGDSAGSSGTKTTVRYVSGATVSVTLTLPNP